jgi:DNA-binding transcriptional ArsR family regulator
MLHAPQSLKILQALWKIGRPATIAEVLAELTEEDPDRDYRTVGTLLSKLETAGLVTSELHRQMPTRPAPDPRPRIGREKRFYSPEVSEQQITHQGIDQLFDLLLRDQPQLYGLLEQRLDQRLAELGIAGNGARQEKTS